MLEIGRARQSGVHVRRVTKRKEQIVGFDWLWLIRRPGRFPAIYVVQAKKMKLERSQAYSYGRIRYQSGSRYQIDALGDFARRLGAIPMYCFYNNVDHRTALDNWNCLLQQPPDVRQMGCTLVPLDVTRTVLTTVRVQRTSDPFIGAPKPCPGDVCFIPPAMVSAPALRQSGSSRPTAVW